jgi:hypothetical protein
MDGNICLHSGRTLAEPYSDICDICEEIGGLSKKEPVPVCRHMEDTGEEVPDRPCKGTYVVCRNDDAPIVGVERTWTSCQCKPSKCRYFEKESEDE